MKLSRIINIIDVEATCWNNEDDRKGQPNEIIEIGISEVDLYGLTIQRSNHFYIKPKESTISEFCNKLTGITEKTIEEQGMPLGAAVRQLKLSYRTHKRHWVSWGDYDKYQFQRDFERNNLEYTKIFFKRHTNFKTVFAMLHGLENEIGVQAALEHVGLKFIGSPHSGKDDAYNISRLYIQTLHKFRTGKHRII